MRILFLSDNFPPEGNAPATRVYEHAVHWVRLGHDVTVLTCAPNFPEGVVYQGYTNRWYSVTNMDGIRVVRLKTYITANEGFLKRTLDYMSFMVVAFFAGLFQQRPDVVVGTSPQFFTVCAAWALAFVRRRAFVFELRDLWPASIVTVGAMSKGRTVRALERLEMFLYRRARAIVSVTHSFKQEIVERGVDAKKVHVVLNGINVDAYQPEPRDEALARTHGVSGKFVVGYVGTHGLAHDLGNVLSAAELLSHREDIVFMFVGGGAARDQLVTQAEERQLSNVALLPRQPKAQMPGFVGLCDVSLIHLKNDPLFSTVIPSKIFEAMGMGTPMLVALPEGEATEIVRREGAGVVVKPGEPKALADAVVALADDRSALTALRDGCIAARPKYDRRAKAEQMLGVLEPMVSSRGQQGVPLSRVNVPKRREVAGGD